MDTPEVLERIARTGIVPVITIEQVQHALPLADALLAAGIPIIEITFRTAAAADVIGTLVRERPQLTVGAGTVLTRENVRAASQAGAQFALAPGLNPHIVKLAAEFELPFVPGIATASEVELALSLGCRMLKFFPAELLGGVEMIKALSAPYGHTHVRFIPTGGVNPANLESYLACKHVAAVGGTWLAKNEDLAGNKWGEIRRRCEVAVETERRTRRPGE